MNLEDLVRARTTAVDAVATRLDAAGCGDLADELVTVLWELGWRPLPQLRRPVEDWRNHEARARRADPTEDYVQARRALPRPPATDTTADTTTSQGGSR